MSKSLKDIVEDGFGKLASLSEKRKELMARAEELSGGDGSRQGQQAIQKIEFAETNYKDEISSHVSHSQEVLKQALAQVVEDNERFLSGVKENLQLRISRVSKELSQTREWLLSGSSEKLNSSVQPIDREMDAGITDLKFEAVKLLGELESMCKRSESALHEAQAENSGKLYRSQHELTSSLSSGFTSIVDQSETLRQKLRESLENLYSEQSSRMTVLSEDLDIRITAVVNENIGSVKGLGKTAEKELEQVKVAVINSATEQIITLSKESLSELELSHEFSNQELSEKLSDLQTNTDELVQQVKQFLDELEKSVKNGCELVCDQMKNRPLALDDESPARGAVEDAVKQLSRELDLNLSEFKRQLNELLKIQSDRLSNLCSTTENSITATATSVNAELKQMTRLYDQTWSEREQEILSRLRKLEKETQDASSRVSGNGSIDNESGSV